MIKLPSLTSIVEIGVKTFYRFPFAILSSFLGMVLMVHAIELNVANTADIKYFQAVFTCMLGISFFFSLSLLSERYSWKPLIHYGSQMMGVLLLLLYFFSLPNYISQISEVRLVLLTIGLHLLVTFILFIGKDQIQDFWQFNITLFIRICTAVVFTHVIFIGLLIALISVEKLFELDFKPYIYAQLWFVIVGMFNAWFFFAGVPQKDEVLEQNTTFIKALKGLAQYVLFPLVSVYFVILFFYIGKIVIQWKLPVGWVSYLVIFYSSVGMFSLVLLNPSLYTEGNAWIQAFRKWFYRALFPLLILLFIAITTRTSEYGITENRYFVLIIAFWLTAMMLYFWVSRKNNIAIIPISLCCVAFLSSFGPWSAFSVSEQSQLNRLEVLLTSNGILVNGKINKRSQALGNKETTEISSIVEFLYQRKRLEVMQPWLEPQDYSITLSGSSSPTIVMEAMGLKYLRPWEGVYHRGRGNETDIIYRIDTRNSLVTQIQGYDYSINVDFYSLVPSFEKISYDRDSVKAVYSSEQKLMNIIAFNDTILKFNIQTIVDSLQSKNHRTEFTPEEMTFMTEGKNYTAKMILYEIRVTNEDSIFTIDNIDANIFLKKQ